MEKGKFYITTTLPYVNAAPHIGFALEIVQADVIARYHKLLGDEVVFNTGTDEHGAKVYGNALEEGKDPRFYTDENAEKFRHLKTALNLSYTNFIRTTDERHKKAAQEFWRRCDKNGDIYKKNYRTKYCVGCELEKTDSELKDGRCSLHTNLALETREEENYFFRFSKYGEKLLKLYSDNPQFVVPSSRLHEISRFVEGGLNDFSISRLKEKLPWGVVVPGDAEQVIYVWFDALVNYISTLGWPEDLKKFEEFWPGLQFAGKDNLRQQSAMWQAMLMSAGLPTSKQIFIHGFITSSGEKISKSLGNVVDPFALVKKYGADAVRYYFLREIPSYEDGDYSEKKFRERYNADLANGLGNFTARVLTLALGDTSIRMRANDTNNTNLEKGVNEKIKQTQAAVHKKIEEFKFHEALADLWQLISFGDEYVNKTKPWGIKDPAAKAQTIFNLVVILDNVAALLLSFLPETAKKITQSISWEGGAIKIKKGEALFPRLAA